VTRWPGKVRGALLAAAVVLAPRHVGSQTLVDGVAVTLDGRPITLSEVAFEHEVRGIASRAGNPGALGRTLQARTAIDGIVARKALLAQSPARDSWAAREVARDRARRFLSALGTPAEGRRFLRRWGMSEDDLVDWFRDMVRADAFGERRVGDLPEPTEAECRARFDAAPERYAGSSFVDVRPGIAEALRQERFEAAWDAVVADALSRADVRRTGLADHVLP